jgi:hypothetical protein
MSKKKRRLRRGRPVTQNDKATLPRWLRWLVSELRDALVKMLQGVFISLAMSVIQHAVTDSSWGTSPEATKAQYYQA